MIEIEVIFIGFENFFDLARLDDLFDAAFKFLQQVSGAKNILVFIFSKQIVVGDLFQGVVLDRYLEEVIEDIDF